MLVGGGIGIPPMLETAKQLDTSKELVMGYRDELFLDQELKRYGTLYLATEDGSEGTKEMYWTPSGRMNCVRK